MLGPTSSSYRVNVGVGPSHLTLAEYRDSGNGFFREVYFVKDSLISDGLSHTIAFSERLGGSLSAGSQRANRDYWLAPGGSYNADQLILSCQIAGHSGEGARSVDAGKWWFWYSRELTSYTHTQTPNGKTPDCLWGFVIPPAAGMSTARSAHSGGVNAVAGDGAVRFISDSIRQDVWRALGTRNGREIVE
jgi:hypothetical protein